MKADPFQIGDVLKDQRRFIVPIYQRAYEWTPARQLEKLFDSIEGKARERLAGHGTAYPHYMGALLLSPRGKFAFGTIQVFDVVDGQQRLTTYQVFIAALRDLAKAIPDAALADRLTPFLLNTEDRLLKDPKVERFKLQASCSMIGPLFHDLVDLDRDGLRKKYPGAFYKNGKIHDAEAPLPLRAWWYFREEAEAFVREGGDADRLDRLTALSAFLLVIFKVIVITLDDTDDAQVIFETLNSGGEPLAAMDLVRNDVLHCAIRARRRRRRAHGGPLERLRGQGRLLACWRYARAHQEASHRLLPGPHAHGGDREGDPSHGAICSLQILRERAELRQRRRGARYAGATRADLPHARSLRRRRAAGGPSRASSVCSM